MSIGRYDTPPPQAPLRTEDIPVWAHNLIAWLRTEERDPTDALEDDLVFGGESVANRMYGFEDRKIGPITVPTTYVLVTSPAAGKKKIITDLVIAVTGSLTVQLFKNKNSVRYILEPGAALAIGPPSNEYVLASQAGRYLVLDAVDESLELEVTAYTSGDLHWNGNVVNVD